MTTKVRYILVFLSNLLSHIYVFTRAGLPQNHHSCILFDQRVAHFLAVHISSQNIIAQSALLELSSMLLFFWPNLSLAQLLYAASKSNVTQTICLHNTLFCINILRSLAITKGFKSNLSSISEVSKYAIMASNNLFCKH